jgi:hypothetical protein
MKLPAVFSWILILHCITCNAQHVLEEHFNALFGDWYGTGEGFSGGKARQTIIIEGSDKIKTIFDVSFPEKKFACFGTNNLTRK